MYTVDYLPTNCPNCGAVLHNGKCEYCGTEIRGSSDEPLKYVVERPGCVTLKAKSSMHATIFEYDKDGVMNFMISDLTKKLSDEIAKYMTYQTYYDPCHMEAKIEGKLRIIPPDYKF